MEDKRTTKLFCWYIFVPAVVVLFFMLVVYAIHGIFPFGTESIVHDDMGQCNIPIYYSIWDALHGDGSILYNLRTAGGIFISGEFEGSLSVFNMLFFLICPRDKILESMSFFLMFKMMLASVTAMLLFHGRFRIHPVWQILLSVLYAFNPFLLQYYSNASWLEMVILAPLIFLGGDILFREKKTALYIAAVAYSLILQLYISYMIMLFLFLDGALYILLLLPKAERREAAVRFGVSTVIAMAISAFSFLPCYFYMTSSSRYQTTKGYFSVLMSTAGNSANKIGMLMILTTLPLALTIMLGFRLRKNTKTVLFFGFSILLFILPIFFENINLLWHMGSYVHFPMRYAFLFHLMLLCASAYTLSFASESLFRGPIASKIIASLLAAGIGAVTVVFMSGLFSESGKGILYKQNFDTFRIVFLLCFVMYSLLLLFGAKKVSCILLSGFVLFECVFYAGRAVTTGATRNFEYSLDFIDECDTIHETLPIENDGFTRIKNIDGTLNTNYPLIIGYPSMSNFTHTIPSDIKKTMQKLGYSTVYTRILDTGGTLFTDALLGCRYALSMQQLPKIDYDYCGTAGRYMVYASKYTLPFALQSSDQILSEEIFTDHVFDTYNNVWHTVSGEEQDLFEWPQVESEIENNVLRYDFDIDGTKEVYMVMTAFKKRKTVRFYVNGELLKIPSLGEPDNTLYSSRFNNCLLDLGEFTDTHISVRAVMMNSSVQPEKLKMRIGAMDKALLADFCETVKDSVTVTAQGRTLRLHTTAAGEGRYLLVPVTYNTAARCTVNGRKTQTELGLGTFTAIPLDSGKNDITLSFLPKGYVAGLYVSIAALLLCVLWVFWQKKILSKLVSIKATGKIMSIILTAYFVADVGALTAMYLVPIVCRIYTLITGG